MARRVSASYRRPVIPSADDFAALARSSPWLWTTLHFTHRSGPAEVEAWLRRPGELLVVDAAGREHRESGVPHSGVFVSTDPGFEPPAPVPPQSVEPVRRPDGLVAERPTSWEVEYDDPMWGDYRWVAMLDPVELSHHVAVDRLRVDVVAGRPVWRADLRAEPGYGPRCGGNCCELLYSEAGLMADFSDLSEVPESWRGREYPDHHDVALDVQTGIVVRCLPVGGLADASWLENDILEVDADLDRLFPER